MRASAARIAGRRVALQPRQLHAPLRRHTSHITKADTGASQLLEAFYYGRAFAITLNKRIGEAATDIVAEISKFIAENPTRMQEFQEEVEALVRQEIPADASATQANLPAASTSSAAGSDTPAPDLEAIVDDLRAEVAQARAVLQEIKAAAVAEQQ